MHNDHAQRFFDLSTQKSGEFRLREQVPKITHYQHGYGPFVEEVVKNPNAPHCRRLRALMDCLGYGHRNGQKEFALAIGVEPAQFNNQVNGTPLSKPVAFGIKSTFGVSLDFLWWGERYGLTVDMEKKLRAWEAKTGEPLFKGPQSP